MTGISKRLSSLVLAALSGLGAVVIAAQDPPVFKASVRTVLVYATVTDARGRLVPSLEQADFSIEDSGKSAPLSVFSNDSQPFTAVVMLDTSASMSANVALLKRAAGQFLAGLTARDRAQVGAFNDRIQLSGSFSNRADLLIGELDKLEIGNPTRLHDGIAASLDALRGIEGRRVVLVFSDGDDTGSRIDFKTVLERARDDEVMVYAIGLESEYFNGVRVVKTRPSRDLKRIAEETGGGYFELLKTADLAPTFSRVIQELRSHYLLGFSPSLLDGKMHRLEVRVAKPGMTVRARRNYTAAPDSISRPGQGGQPRSRD